jgi:hypothetical protein
VPKAGEGRGKRPSSTEPWFICVGDQRHSTLAPLPLLRCRSGRICCRTANQDPSLATRLALSHVAPLPGPSEAIMLLLCGACDGGIDDEDAIPGLISHVAGWVGGALTSR